MVNIDYDGVTIDLAKYVVDIQLSPKSMIGQKLTYANFDKDAQHVWKPSLSVGQRRAKSKCFSIVLPFLQDEQLTHYVIGFKSSIFPNGIRPDTYNWTTGNGFAVTHHYPNQSLRFTDSKDTWKRYDKQPSAYQMRFTYVSMDTLWRRNTHAKPCENDWLNVDAKFAEALMFTVGCKPPHWKRYETQTILPICTTKEEMTQFNWTTEYKLLNEFPPPCQTITTISYDYAEHDLSNYHQLPNVTTDDKFYITVVFQQNEKAYYQEIKHIRAMTGNP